MHLMLCKYTGFDGADGMDLLAVPSVEEKSAKNGILCLKFDLVILCAYQ